MKSFSRPQLGHCEESGFEQQPPSIDLCVPLIVGELALCDRRFYKRRFYRLLVLSEGTTTSSLIIYFQICFSGLGVFPTSWRTVLLHFARQVSHSNQFHLGNLCHFDRQQILVALKQSIVEIYGSEKIRSVNLPCHKACKIFNRDEKWDLKYSGDIEETTHLLVLVKWYLRSVDVIEAKVVRIIYFRHSLGRLRWRLTYAYCCDLQDFEARKVALPS